jgi:peptidoglycan/LPS O-acetylase OafA/YrhL
LTSKNNLSLLSRKHKSGLNKLLLTLNDKPSIGDLLRGKDNNFDLIRFFAATLVIFSHSYPLTLRTYNKYEPLYYISNGQDTLGQLAVFIFFITSGLLITQSYERCDNVLHFLRARVLRIFPALIVVVLLTVFVLGPMVTNLTLQEYFTNPITYDYLQTAFLNIKYYLPGVFENNVYKNNVNSSIWTLKIEFVFYIVVAVLGFLKLLKKEIVLLMFLTTLVLSFLNLKVATDYIEMFIFFSAGMVIYLYRFEIKLNSLVAFFSIVFIIITLFTGGFPQAFSIFGAYLIMMIAFSQKFKFANFSKHGDFSYGIYIYAFPVQQTICYYFNNTMTPFLNFIIAFPITLLFAILSWKLIEKNALSLKKYSFAQMMFYGLTAIRKKIAVTELKSSSN